MSLNPWILRVAILTAIGLPFADPADAQTCNTPIPLIGEHIVIDTCEGDTNLPVVCNGAVPLTGPALVMSVHLPYPNGRLQVQSMDAGLDAAAFFCRDRAIRTRSALPRKKQAARVAPRASNSTSLIRVTTSW